MGRRASVCTAWVDASAGIAGDMLLGALIDLGAEPEAVQKCVDAVIPETVRLALTTVTRAGLRATKVDVELLAQDQPHRSWTEIRARIGAAELPDRTRTRALTAFEALARAEADVHGVEVEDVHFHEVGAWDSIADVVGVCAALEDLGVDELVVSRIAVGSGSVQAAHGRIPVPGPAVLGLVTGWEIEAVGEGELATPTGVALATTLAAGQGPVPAMQVLGSGTGAGTKEVADRSNVVRVVLGVDRPVVTAGESGDAGLAEAAMTLLEANVDDLDPRVWPTVLDALLDVGAADAWLTPILMKRGRPAHTLSVLAHEADVERLRDAALATTSTIGIRAFPVRRWSMARGWATAEVEGQLVRVKVAHRAGLVVHAMPEFRDVEAAAMVLGRPVRDILDEAIAQSARLGIRPGAAVPDLAGEPPC